MQKEKTIDERFDELFAETEGCQAYGKDCGIKDDEGQFLCTYCRKWGGPDGTPKNNKRPIASTKEIKVFIHQLLNEKGEAMKVSDTRSRSQQLRGVIWKQWQASGQDISEDDFYDKKMVEIISQQINY